MTASPSRRKRSARENHDPIKWRRSASSGMGSVYLFLKAGSCPSSKSARL